MMSRTDLLRRLEAIANADPGSLSGSEPLEDLDDWDSLAVLSTLALFDKEFGLVLPADKLHECRDMDAIIALVGDAVKD